MYDLGRPLADRRAEVEIGERNRCSCPQANVSEMNSRPLPGRRPENVALTASFCPWVRARTSSSFRVEGENEHLVAEPRCRPEDDAAVSSIGNLALGRL